MARLNEILELLRNLAPEATALPDDPIGLLIGSDNPSVRKIGVCLDATPRVARQAAEAEISLLIAHHPLIYRPLKRIDSDPTARAVATLVKADIALYAMHTNWDAAPGGVNDTLAAILGLQNVRRLGENGELSLPRIGDLPAPMPLSSLIRDIEARLQCSGTSAIRVNDIESEKTIARVGVCGGAGAFLATDLQAAGADAYVTSDVRHHEFLDTAARGLALIDAGHDATETPGMRALAKLLASRLPEIEVVWYGTTATN